MLSMIRTCVYLLILMSLISCSSDQNKTKTNETSTMGFKQLPVTQTKIDFRNDITESPQFNFLYYPYIYNGGGLAAGDINNDGLIDLYFTANMGANKLYLNKGDLVFEDITGSANVEDAEGWTTGVSMIDINNDGLLDIYVCKSASLQNPEARRNKLYINNGDLSFSEKANEYGLDDAGYSTQAYFLDIENDGDLDMYLVNHRPDFNNNSKISSEIQRAITMESSDQLYRNEGNTFIRITQSAGLLNKAWGLSAAIHDFNNDGYADIYVCNDFLEPDHLYINQKNGSFKDEVLSYVNHISFYSMGSDIADINNDNLMDLVVLDMVSEDHIRSKRNMAAMSSSTFRTMVNIGYHHQYMSNVLQLNRGNGHFSEIGQMAGISKTDWSWAPLLADFDNDGWKDLFVTNGIRRDVTDNDYKIELRKKNEEGSSMSLDEIFNLVPTQKSVNYTFKNNGNLSFENVSQRWGLDQSLHSNGAVYADLDNDGDLDLAVNNIDDYASIYSNNGGGNSISLKLEGDAKNKNSLGAKVIISHDGHIQSQELYFNRGFQSSMAVPLHFGLGDLDNVNIEVTWPDGSKSGKANVKANSRVTIAHGDPNNSGFSIETDKALFAKVDPGIEIFHRENDFDDFAREILLPQKMSNQGPALAVGDVNGDNKKDIFLGGARGEAPQLFIQTQNGFEQQTLNWSARETLCEDTGALFFDADGDGDQDLYVVSGGNEANSENNIYQDRLFFNDGDGNFKKDVHALPTFRTSGKCVKASDFDGDGDLDLFVGGRQIPGKYPFPASSYILRNEGGKFKDVTKEVAPLFTDLGMVTDASFSDYDGDGDDDLFVVGEWMPLTIFKNEGGLFDRIEKEEFGYSNGWWYSIAPGDFDNDGDQDFVVGNLGLNNKFGAKPEKPFHVYCDDFDDNGTYDIVLSKEGKGKLLPVRGRECSSEQMPFIVDKFPTYKQFAEAGLDDIYGEKLNTALHYEVYTFANYYVENKGDGSFEMKMLPAEAQMGPIMDLIVKDINKDGQLDILAVGNIYEAEVETIRYDASLGTVLLGNGKGGFEVAQNSGFINKHNAKAIENMNFDGQDVFIVGNNDGPLSFFKVL